MNDTNATVPVSEVRSFIRRIAVDGGLLQNRDGAWRLSAQTPFPGLDTTATYQSEDKAIDAILGVYFPTARNVRAA